MNYYVSNPEETKELLPRFRIFYGLLFFTVTVFSCRLWYLQIIEGSELREFSEKNRIKQNKINAPRGIVFDREGKVLVENRPGFEATLSPQYIEDIDKVAKAISPIIALEPEKIIQKVIKSRKQNGPFALVRVKENLTKDEVFRLKRISLDTPGLDIRETVLRAYPLKENGAQLFGYVGEISKRQIPTYNQLYRGLMTFEQGDVIGKSGIEEILERDIRGQDGVQFVQVDAFGRETQNTSANIYGEQIKDLDPEPGHNIVLTIDKTLQEVAYKKFTDEKRVGAVIAMKSDGEVLAWVSTPSFDPNEFSTGISPVIWSKLINDPDKPLRNKVIQDHYPPGSTFKAFMALAALQEKVISANSIVYCPPVLQFGRRPYHDHLKGGFGNISIYEALERSSNVFFYKLGISLGIDKMFQYISPLGVGQRTGIELARENSGLMPSSQWKKATYGEEWQPGENLSNAIGQGFVQVTPLQLAVGYNAIGTGGKVVKPFVIKRIVNNDGKVLKENQPQVTRDLTQLQSTGSTLDPATFNTVKDALRRVVQGTRGTARSVHIPGADIAGKTGTTQVMGFSADQIYAKCENRPVHQRHHGWFVAFAPAENPEIVVAALAEHSCHGVSGGGPVVKELMKTYFEKYKPELLAAAATKKAKAPVAEEVSVPLPDGE